MGSRTFLFVKNQFILILLSLEKIHFAQNIVYQYDIFGKHQQIAGIYWNNFFFQDFFLHFWLFLFFKA